MACFASRQLALSNQTELHDFTEIVPIWIYIDLPQVYFQTPTNKREPKSQQNQSEKRKEGRGNRLVGFAQS